MAAVAGPGLCEKETHCMNKKRTQATVTAGTRAGPVRVRLQRLNCDAAKPYPPQGMTHDWWQKLNNALGTASSAFVNASLVQLIAAAKLPGGGLSETAVNASLAFIENAKPKDEVESALLIQMACTHTAAMSVLATFAGGYSYGRDVPLKASAAARLMRAYATQVETLRRLRNGGSQVVRVEHVHVNEGGRALIGNVRKDGSSAAEIKDLASEEIKRPTAPGFGKSAGDCNASD
jgi:hypothetical protein